MTDTKEVVKEIAKDVYNDAGKSIVKPTGELFGLVPRAIKAALAPVEKWVLQREYNLEATKKLLEEKLKDTPADLIESPEPHVAVPALQYISYCMNNNELRDMYANLLANSMNKVVKNGVHPSFVEIIKQLCPDEAKILRYISIHPIIPTITIRVENIKGEGFNLFKKFSNIGELVSCENPYEISQYFDNLLRLGILETPGGLSSLTHKDLYDVLKNHPYVRNFEIPKEYIKYGFDVISLVESFLRLTDFGNAFCEVCLGTMNE